MPGNAVVSGYVRGPGIRTKAGSLQRLFDFLRGNRAAAVPSDSSQACAGTSFCSGCHQRSHLSHAFPSCSGAVTAKESFFVALGTLCFVTRVVSPGIAGLVAAVQFDNLSDSLAMP